MAETAFQIQFRQQTVAAFESGASIVADMTTKELVLKGNQATFLVAGSGNAAAVTRGVNGKIPSRAMDLTQITATLTEWHDKPILTGFNIFSSQGNITSEMQRTSVEVINRKRDADIISTLNTASVTLGAAAAITPDLVARAVSKLQLAKAPINGMVFGLLTPAAHARLMGTAAFASVDYVDSKPWVGASQAWENKTGKTFRWGNVLWAVHPDLPNAGTDTEVCFVFHQNAIGHAFNIQGATPGYDEEDDYSFARCTGYMGSVLLQNSGVVKINHLGAAYS